MRKEYEWACLISEGPNTELGEIIIPHGGQVM